MPVIGADIHCCTGSPETRCLHRQSHDDGSQTEANAVLHAEAIKQLALERKHTV